MITEVDTYFTQVKKWREELELLRQILLDCQLAEELKWGKPCYTYRENNVAILYGLKDYCGISFLKGVLLQDTENILVAPGENSQSARLHKFKSVAEIKELEKTLKAYVYESIEVEKAGLKVDFKEKNQLEFPEELLEIFEERPELKRAFEALTPGRQRGYNLHFTSPKVPKTRKSRIEQCSAKIMMGKGFHDCTCGQSKRMPRCDGSHKNIS